MTHDDVWAVLEAVGRTHTGVKWAAECVVLGGRYELRVEARLYWWDGWKVFGEERAWSSWDLEDSPMEHLVWSLAAMAKCLLRAREAGEAAAKEKRVELERRVFQKR